MPGSKIGPVVGVILAGGRAVRITRWTAGTDDVFASRTFTLARPRGVTVRERFELVGSFDPP